ncbi:phosphoglycerate mutase-like protein 4 isoform X2 [Eurytemora carolleeae]|uniref:phosphoglycerate mutase-like protein 4 isoform X2 n=1 Tax=Eurytemora carolleeae TaxID=1294199 RepID=UPI000C757687|nr:phosphoglycerate mutase-like protein 4 isoform X2 [Eurytemora carolleeae]|eukprot:XP_023322894.1 phosphoglycerate mutase-like protein 4 isoform X2 [Eurytemora affinis]
MIELVLVRHGETEANKTHTIQGHLDTDLSELGVKQAEMVGESLAKHTFHLALTSDLKRAKCTGEEIRKRNPSFESLEELQVLRERCFGDLEGKPLKTMLEAIKGLDRSKLQSWGPDNGESGDMFRERIEMFIKTLGEKVQGMDNPCVLATTHGGFIKDFNLLLVNKYQCSFPCQNGEYGRISPNTGVSKYFLDFNDSGELVKATCTQLYNKDHLNNLATVEPVLYGI